MFVAHHFVLYLWYFDIFKSIPNRRLTAIISRKRSHFAPTDPDICMRATVYDDDIINFAIFLENQCKGFGAIRPRKWNFPLKTFIALTTASVSTVIYRCNVDVLWALKHAFIQCPSWNTATLKGWYSDKTVAVSANSSVLLVSRAWRREFFTECTGFPYGGESVFFAWKCNKCPIGRPRLRQLDVLSRC